MAKTSPGPLGTQEEGHLRERDEVQLFEAFRKGCSGRWVRTNPSAWDQSGHW